MALQQAASTSWDSDFGEISLQEIEYLESLPDTQDDFDLESFEELTRTVPSALEEKEKKKKTKLLNKDERSEILKSVNREHVISHVMNKVPSELMSTIFPSRLEFWESIQQSDAFKSFITKNIDHYLELYLKHSKGKDKYANLYIDWMKVMTSYTCKSQQTVATVAELGLLATKNEVNTTVIASVLHALQEGVQIEMSKCIETLHTVSVPDDFLSDDTGLYRISGWALKSSIDHKRGDLKNGRGNMDITKKEIEILTALKCTMDEKGKLPLGTQIMDRGGLTYIKPKLLSWVRAVEVSMKENLNHKGYQKYGKNIFKVTRSSILLDKTLLSEFSKSVIGLHPGTDQDMIKSVHALLLHKIYNVRSNEFLRNIGKTDCMKQKKAVDANVGLRDTLKTFAVKKQSEA